MRQTQAADAFHLHFEIGVAGGDGRMLRHKVETERKLERYTIPFDGEPANVVLDLTRLRFIDSSGLGAFLSCLRKLNQKQGDLKLCGVSKQVRAVLELVRMHRILDICGTRQEAARAYHP